MNVIAILALLMLGCTLSSAKTPFIIGGTLVTDRSKFAYQISLQFQGSHICGGTIINNNTVLTAAHCVLNEDGELVPTNKLKIVTGLLNIFSDPNARAYQVSRIIVHQDYSKYPSPINDLAALKISNTFSFTSETDFIDTAIDTPSDATKCTVSGWGTESIQGSISADLQYVEVPTVNYETCKSAYKRLGPDVLCAGQTNKDSCLGDSGGPLICNNKLAGVVSYGIGCGEANYPGVYTNVAKYGKWIEEQKKASNAFCAKLFLPLLILALLF